MTRLLRELHRTRDIQQKKTCKSCLQITTLRQLILLAVAGLVLGSTEEGKILFKIQNPKMQTRLVQAQIWKYMKIGAVLSKTEERERKRKGSYLRKGRQREQWAAVVEDTSRGLKWFYHKISRGPNILEGPRDRWCIW